MQGRNQFEENCQRVDKFLNIAALCDSTSPSDVYSNLIEALNWLTSQSTLDKAQRATYRERLSEALRARITKALNSKNQSELTEEMTGLARVIKEVTLLQGFGGLWGSVKHKTDAKKIADLFVEVKKGSENPRGEALLSAALSGEYDRVKKLLGEGVDVNYQSTAGFTALHHAARKHDVTLIKLFLECKANPNQVSSVGNTPLHMAVEGSHPELWLQRYYKDSIGALLENGANVNMRNNSGYTPLGRAMLLPYTEPAIDLIYLMVKGASLSVVNDGATIYACLIEDLNHAYQNNELSGRLSQVYFSEILSKLVDAFKNKLDFVIKTINCTYSHKHELLKAELHGLRAVLDEVRLLKNDSDISKVVVTALSDTILEIVKQLEQLEIFDSVAQGNLEKLKDFIKRGIDINIQDEEGHRLLDRAAVFGRGDIARFLINQNADINCQNKEGYTPLLSATWYGNEDLVRFLIDRNADINQVDNHGNTPLYLAADRGCADIAEVLIEKGVDYNQIRSWFENNLALYVPVWPPGYGIDPRKVGVAKLLLNTLVQKASLLDDHAAQPAASPENETIYSLLIATLNHDKLKPSYKNNKVFRGEIRTWLAEALSKKASVVVKGDLQNIEAELKGLHAIIKEVDLLDRTGRLGREKRAVTDIKRCIQQLEAALNQRKAVEVDPPKALFKAAKKGDLEKVKDLIAAGVEIDCQDAEGRTPLNLAAREGRVDIVEFLINQGANISQANFNGCTPLITAALEGRLEAVRLLLKNKAAVDLADSYGCTPLIMAAYRGHKEVVQILLEVKAAVNHQNIDCATPLYLAAQQGHLEIVQLLLEKNANFTHTTAFGGTPIFIAAQQGHPGVVEALIQAGADINQYILLGEGKTPLDITEYNGYKNVVQVIKNAQDKKIRSFMPGLSLRVDLQAGNYSELIRYLNDEEPKYSHSQSLRKMIRLTLIQALKERVEAVRFEGNAEIIQAELKGFKQIKDELRIIQKAGHEMIDKRAMKKIDSLIKLLSNPQGRLADSKHTLHSSNFNTDDSKQKPEPKGTAFALFSDL